MTNKVFGPWLQQVLRKPSGSSRASSVVCNVSNEDSIKRKGNSAFMCSVHLCIKCPSNASCRHLPHAVSSDSSVHGACALEGVQTNYTFSFSLSDGGKLSVLLFKDLNFYKTTIINCCIFCQI